MLTKLFTTGVTGVALATTSLSFAIEGAIGCARPSAPVDAVRIAVASPPESLDPRFATSAVATRLAALVAAPLVAIGPDLRPHPLVAEAFEHPDPVTYVVKLRQGLVFPDGNPVTARDVRYSLASIKDPSIASPHASKMVHVKDIVVVDDRTVRIELDAPYPAFPVDLNAYGVVEERACSSSPAACREMPMGIGPFFVEHPLDRDERLVLRRNPSFTKAIDVPSTNAVNAIEVRVVRDGTTRLFLLEDGRIDFVGGDLLPTDLAVIAKRDAKDLVVDEAPGLGFSYLALNVRGPHANDSAEATLTHRALADARVRRALAMALDVDAVIKAKLLGHATRATGLLPESHWAKADSDTPIAFDPDKARAMLDASGFPTRARGGRFHVELLTTTDRLRRATALVFADQWRAVGLDVDVVVRDWSALYEDIQRGSFDAFSAKWTPVLEPDLLHWVYASSSIPSPQHAGGNRSGYSDPDVDSWLNEAEATDDESERIALYEQAQERIARDLPLIPLWFENESVVHSSRVVGFHLDSTASLLPIARASLAP